MPVLKKFNYYTLAKFISINQEVISSRETVSEQNRKACACHCALVCGTLLCQMDQVCLGKVFQVDADYRDLSIEGSPAHA